MLKTWDDWGIVEVADYIPSGLYDLKIYNGNGEYFTEIRTLVHTSSVIDLDRILTATFGEPVIAHAAKRVPDVPRSTGSVTMSVTDYDELLRMAQQGVDAGGSATRADSQILFGIIGRVTTGR